MKESSLIHQSPHQRNLCQAWIESLWSDRTSWAPLTGRESSPTRTRIARRLGPRRQESMRIRFRPQTVSPRKRKYSPKSKDKSWLKTGRPIEQTKKSINSLRITQIAWLMLRRRNRLIPCIAPDHLTNLSTTKRLSLTRATQTKFQRASDRPSYARCSHFLILRWLIIMDWGLDRIWNIINNSNF